MKRFSLLILVIFFSVNSHALLGLRQKHALSDMEYALNYSLHKANELSQNVSTVGWFPLETISKKYNIETIQFLKDHEYEAKQDKNLKIQVFVSQTHLDRFAVKSGFLKILLLMVIFAFVLIALFSRKNRR